MGQHLAGQADGDGVHERDAAEGGGDGVPGGEAERLGEPEAVGEGRERHPDWRLRDGEQGEEQDRERAATDAER